MAIGVGQRCVVRIQITDIELRKAKDIMATIVSPQGDEKCQDVSFDEVSGLVYVSVDVNGVGSWSMWLGVRFAEEIFYTPSFVFAEVEGDAKPCDAPYIVDVEVSGESVTVTPPKIDVDAVTQEEFDALASKVESKVDKVEGKGLSTNDFTDEYKKKVDEFSGGGGGSITIDKELSPTSDNAIANSAVVNGLAGLAEGVSEAIGNVAKNVEQNTADIKTKQDTLTITTKPNGNIVIGNLPGQSKEFMPATPSGDPMHYAYEAVGAVWNASTGYWSYRAEEGGLSDLTNADMRLAYVEAYLSTAIDEGVRFGGTARLLINKTEWASAKAIGNSYCKNNNLEVAEIARKHQNCIFSTAYNCFNYNPKLHTILGLLDYKYSSGAGSAPPYKECYALQNITVRNLKHNIAFSDSSHLSKESLLYMINNCASNATFTITLHPDVYAKCTRVDEGEGQYIGEWWDEIDDALGGAVESKNTNITLASA